MAPVIAVLVTLGPGHHAVVDARWRYIRYPKALPNREQPQQSLSAALGVDRADGGIVNLTAGRSPRAATL